MSDENQLIEWFKKSLNTENCTVKLEGTTVKGSGYIADIFFAKVTLENKNEVNLIAKVSRDGESRSFTEDVCKREVFIYKNVLPIFKQFQEEKNITDPFNAVPKCYQAFITEKSEVIIQENLKTRGYELHEKSLPMNLNHIKLALKNYAKFHAISLALADQKPEVFKNIEDKCDNLMRKKLPFFKNMHEQSVNKIIKNLIEAGREDLSERYKKLLSKGTADILIELLDDLPNEKVLTHADCHNGNFMFKYKDGNKENPSNMVFIDFQICFVFSPIIDLSIYFYCGVSKKELSHFTELMEFYHKELSLFLSKLGSDADKLFPISTMWQHWKKYSFYGFNTATMFLELLFVEPGDAPVLKGTDDTFNQYMSIKLNNRPEYLKRLADIVEHYTDFNNNN